MWHAGRRAAAWRCGPAHGVHYGSPRTQVARLTPRAVVGSRAMLAGALNKPKFLAPGDSYKATPNSTQFFSRGTSTLKCGAPKRRDTRAGAVHDVEDTGTPTRCADRPRCSHASTALSIERPSGGLRTPLRPARLCCMLTCGAPVHTGVWRSPRRAPTGPGFKPGGRGNDLFSRTGGLGPAERPTVHVVRGGGGACLVRSHC